MIGHAPAASIARRHRAVTPETWARLVPELLCSDVGRSLAFYRDVLGFRVLYDRPEEGFAYLDLEGAQVMLERESDFWTTGERVRPFGRGVNFQIEVADIGALHDRVVGASVALFRPMEDRWYRQDDVETGNRQFLVQDPDGYLLRFFQDLGTRARP